MMDPELNRLSLAAVTTAYELVGSFTDCATRNNWTAEFRDDSQNRAADASMLEYLGREEKLLKAQKGRL